MPIRRFYRSSPGRRARRGPQSLLCLARIDSDISKLRASPEPICLGEVGRRFIRQSFEPFPQLRRLTSTKLIPPSFKSIGAPRPPIPCADQKCPPGLPRRAGFSFVRPLLSTETAISWAYSLVSLHSLPLESA